MLAALALWSFVAQDVPKYPPHYAAVPMTCPVGREKFSGPSLMHYSTFGAMPDGQPFGSVGFPVLLAECPGNGLVIYRQFSSEAVAALPALLASEAYRGLRASETAYYRAYWLAKSLGDTEEALWLLQSAIWDAKNKGDAALARRHGLTFVAEVTALPADPKSPTRVALRARAANAMRELGQFDDAEALRASIAIDPAMGGSDEGAARNRKGWADYLAKLAAPIARRDAGRMPIDLLDESMAAARCLDPESKREGASSKPLSAFEAEYCATPAMKTRVDTMRTARGGAAQ
jgi:hypothetical protein